MASEVGVRRWQRDVRSLKGGLAQSWKRKVFSDCQFTVGARIFKGHRLYFAARSPVFAKMLMKEGSVKPVMIEITDMSEDGFDILFNYIYTDSIGKLGTMEFAVDHNPENIRKMELVVDVYQAAVKYELNGLKQTCEEIINKWKITVLNVIYMLQMSDVLFLRNRCWEFLSSHAEEVLKSDGILPATSDTFASIFERGYLKRVTPFELLSNMVRWASNQYSKQTDYKIVREHLLVPSGTTYKALIGWIGFDKFTAAELGQVISNYPKLLTDEEIVKFLQYSTATGDNKPELPSW